MTFVTQANVLGRSRQRVLPAEDLALKSDSLSRAQPAFGDNRTAEYFFHRSDPHRIAIEYVGRHPQSIDSVRSENSASLDRPVW